MSLKRISILVICAFLTSTTAWATEGRNVETGQRTNFKVVTPGVPNQSKIKVVTPGEQKHRGFEVENSEGIEVVRPSTNKQGLKKGVPSKSKIVKVAKPKPKPKPVSHVEVRWVYTDGSPIPAEKLEGLKVKQEKLNKAREKLAKRKKTDASKDKEKKQNQGKKNLEIEERAFYYGAMLPRNYKDIGIYGEAECTPGQAVAYIRNNNPQVKLPCTPEKLVLLYWEEAKKEGVRPDLAFCQAITETGFFRYGGDVFAKQNNFCGLGTTGGGVKGARFKTPQLGVRAHIQHLLAYSRLEKPKTGIVDPRYAMAHDLRVQKGLVDKWSGLNGTWAMGSEYCEKIMSHYVRMLQTPAEKGMDFSTTKTNKLKSSKERVVKPTRK